MGADNQAEKVIDRIERMERMQAEIERLELMCTDTIKHLEEAEIEIKRLTSERNDYEAEGRRHIKTIAELRHENARLLKDYALDSANQRLLSEIEDLKLALIRATAENAQLNARLKP